MVEVYDSNMGGEERNFHASSGAIQTHPQSETFDDYPLNDEQAQSDAETETELQIVPRNYGQGVGSVTRKTISSGLLHKAH
jgi:hypothetical protein